MIHKSSVVDSTAKISKSVKIGPFCYIGPEVQLDDTWNGAERSLVLEFVERTRGPVTPHMFLNFFGRDSSGR